MGYFSIWMSVSVAYIFVQFNGCDHICLDKYKDNNKIAHKSLTRELKAVESKKKKKNSWLFFLQKAHEALFGCK